MNFWGLTLAGIAQIAFWLVVGTLAVLTYLQARKTVFQPIKTEVFKLQLASLTNLSKHLYGLNDRQLYSYFGLDRMLHENAWLALDEYAESVLGAVSPRLLSGEKIETSSRDLDALWRDSTPEERLQRPRLGGTDLDSFECDGVIFASDSYMDNLRSLELSAADPLIPSDIQAAVQDFVSRLDNSLELIPTVIRDCSEFIADNYGSIESLNKANVNEFSFRWERKRIPLEPAAQKIITLIRERYRPDRVGYTA